MNLRIVWLILLFVFSFEGIVFAQEKTESPYEQVFIAAFAADAKWLEEHKAHIELDGEPHALPFVLRKVDVGSMKRDDGPVGIEFNEEFHPIVVTPNVPLEIYIFNTRLLPVKEFNRTFLVSYTLFGPAGYDWKKKWKKPTCEELEKFVRSSIKSAEPAK